jgi:hypothetical protein
MLKPIRKMKVKKHALIAATTATSTENSKVRKRKSVRHTGKHAKSV